MRLTCSGLLVHPPLALLAASHHDWPSALPDQAHPGPSHARASVLAGGLGEEVTATTSTSAEG